jgi:hypothetical protein
VQLYQKRKTEVRQGKKLPENLRARPVNLQEIADAALVYSRIEKASYQHDEYRMVPILEQFGDRAAESILPEDPRLTGLQAECSWELTILTDPWWSAPAYRGQWYPYPLPVPDQFDLRGLDAIYISHGHEDHLDCPASGRPDHAARRRGEIRPAGLQDLAEALHRLVDGGGRAGAGDDAPLDIGE